MMDTDFEPDWDPEQLRAKLDTIRERVRDLRAWATSRIHHTARMEMHGETASDRIEAIVERRALTAVIKILDGESP